MNKERFLAISKICLNNWHYISQKILSLHEEINFITGHSGSGKSTIIDALQLALYANTDGRAFFNKAAADDSDRNLIEYLRGMVNIGEDNQFSYLRNHNFSTTIVIELEQTDTLEKQCIGVVFDVETSNNSFHRMFFWHKDGLLSNGYRDKERAMSIQEIRKYLKLNFCELDYKTYSTNESFRNDLYNRYLGGLDKEKFPMLFKKAIPFRMNMKIEDFIKEYICMEQNIEIEAMQESVMQYGRMRKKIEDTTEEIKSLEEISRLYEQVVATQRQVEQHQFFLQELEVLRLKSVSKHLSEKEKKGEEDGEILKTRFQEIQGKISQLKQERDDLIRQIHETGYDGLKNELASVNELLLQYTKNIAKWEKIALALGEWEDQSMVSNSTIWDIQKFQKHLITKEELERLQRDIFQYRKEVKEQRAEVRSQHGKITEEITHIQEQLDQMNEGKKAYPKEVEHARIFLEKKLEEKYRKNIQVEVLADLQMLGRTDGEMQ